MDFDWIGGADDNRNQTKEWIEGFKWAAGKTVQAAKLNPEDFDLGKLVIFAAVCIGILDLGWTREKMLEEVEQIYILAKVRMTHG